MSNTKTQCPHCHTCYPMPENRLNDLSLKAVCKNCGKSFLPNHHLQTDNHPTVAAAHPSASAKAINPAPKQVLQHTTQEQDLGGALPKIPTKKKKLTVAQEGMIHDNIELESNSAEFAISDDELNDFIARASSPLSEQSIVAPSLNKNTDNHKDDDEAWLDALLKNEDSPNITVMPSEPEQKQNIPLIAGEDLTALIPEAHRQEDPKVLMQKMQARLASPTQEQIVTKRSPLASFGWILGCLALVFLAIAQYLYFNQQAIAKNPSQSAWVKKLCSSCQLPSADLNAFKISHQLQQGSADFSTNLVGTLFNHSDTQQLYPNLKIAVIGTNGVLGELVLAPKDYLVFDKALINTKSDERFMLTLDVPKDEIASIQIEPFY